ncbi:Sentrin-specific protease 7 [Phytophthora cinnamomi]|uniref:Sentrin-specific protease 7 n=1 Tax=Phytophthora cinnamomi TaxID=4785 RepID=UPI0035595454|nr:Sentrin-specific protease 7 [Phytophthora cinnamomi]
MRLGLTSPSLRMGAQTSATRRSPPPLSRASAFSPIDVDGDSSDDAEPRSSPGPSLSTRTLHYESSDDSEQAERAQGRPRAQSQPQQQRRGPSEEPQQTDKGQRLNFFFQYGSPRQRRREDAQLSGSSAQSSPAKDELHEVICAPRTNVCGEKYDRCEMEFQQDRVELTIWQAGKRQWQGRSSTPTWGASVSREVCSKKNEKEVMTPKVFGVVFYFDEEMEVMRCQSMGDSNPRLAQLFSEKLSDSEVRDYSKWDATHKLRVQQRIESKSSASSSAGGRLASFTKHAFGSVKTFFTPRSSVLEEDSGAAVVSDHGGATKGGTLNLSRESNGVLRADSGEAKAPIQIDDAVVPDKQDRGPGINNGAVVVIQNSQVDGLEHKAAVVDGLAFSSLEQEEKKSEKVESRKRAAAAARREDEKLKRRRIESRRSEVLLTYPYDGSDTAGRISVTLGDGPSCPWGVSERQYHRLYLRFLWRHLAPWQQQQTYFFTSHFFTQLNGTNGAHELTTADPDERFARVARWTQKRQTSSRNDSYLFLSTIVFTGALQCFAILAPLLSKSTESVPKEKNELGADAVGEEETIITSFDSEGIGLLEPNVPLQSNSSDCGVFLLMYAALIVGHFPAGVTREDLESNLTSTLKPTMFKDEHVLEFREYLQQLIFSLQFLEKHGLPEEKVKEEELEVFNID